MTWILRSSGLLGALVVLLSPISGAAQPTPAELKGKWELVGHRFRTKIFLVVGDGRMVAGLGCEVRDYGFTVAGDAIEVRTDGLVIENPCNHLDLKSKRAWAYWSDLARQIVGSTTVRASKDKLTLASPTGALTFVRMKEYPLSHGG